MVCTRCVNVCVCCAQACIDGACAACLSRVMRAQTCVHERAVRCCECLQLQARQMRCSPAPQTGRQLQWLSVAPNHFRGWARLCTHKTPSCRKCIVGRKEMQRSIGKAPSATILHAIDAQMRQRLRVLTRNSISCSFAGAERHRGRLRQIREGLRRENAHGGGRSTCRARWRNTAMQSGIHAFCNMRLILKNRRRTPPL